MNEFNTNFLLAIKINVYVLLPHTKRKIIKKKITKLGVTPPGVAWSLAGASKGVVTLGSPSLAPTKLINILVIS